VNISSVKSRVEKATTVTNEDTFKTTLEKTIILFKKNGDNSYTALDKYDESVFEYYYLPINDNIFNAFNT
jgi:hypothetical protein